MYLSELVDPLSLTRAEEGLRCLQLKKEFYIAAEFEAFNSETISKRAEFLHYPLSSTQVESIFISLIELGVLRREVDGQGLTERVRLTPMGRQILHRWPENWPSPGILIRLKYNFRHI
uniref:Uncharacterized protein n=1 Tax=Paulinella micropora TaxID=1928728 RepID=A0A385HZB5_9EUKA|nr:hypothetical protein PMNZ_036 [Paulinella micropora]AXY63000.1 hypothetical protein PMNZ_036 [Paulinella micropora]